ncbi:hypothetical protein Catovirus_1_230 [Catovirus CTV1]|uniref:Uncharacterized protein n=1 Tax=Catovirus CTV1 TaxID=1977631 RepID=A0A1V0S8Z0_9VIRU|nr:hypothetical protein Catovirus_1_230 [Catovirus CTV1]
MKYNCELCDYHTDSSASWYIHKKSRKHRSYSEIRENVTESGSIQIEVLKEKLRNSENEKNMIENNLKTIIETQKKSIAILQHDKKKMEKEKNDIITALEQKVQELHTELHQIKDNHINKLEKTVIENDKLKKSMLDSASSIVGKSMTVMEYLAKNCSGAPRLSQLNDYSDLSKNNTDLIKEIVISTMKD